MDSITAYKKYIFTAVSGLVSLPILLQILLDLTTGESVVSPMVLLVLSTIGLATGAGFFAEIPSLFRRFRVTVEPLVALSATSAWIVCLFDWTLSAENIGASYSFYTVMPVFFVHLGRFLEEDALKEAPQGQKAEGYQLPETYSRSSHTEEPLYVRDITIGEDIRVVKGAIIPADGTVHEGMGEVMGTIAIQRAMARICGPGDVVFAGEKLIDGEIIITAQKAGRDSLVFKAIQLDEHMGAEDKTLSHVLPRARFFVTMCFVFAVIGLFYQSLMNGVLEGFKTFFLCMALSIPVTAVISYALPLEWLSTRLKALGAELHSLKVVLLGRNVKTLLVPVLDGFVRPAPKIERVLTSKASEDEIIAVATGLCQQVNHPLSAALGHLAGHKGLTPVAFKSVVYDKGRGLVGEQEHGSYVMGTPALLSHYGVPYGSLDEDLVEYELTCDQVSWVAQARPIKSFMGVMVFSTTLRKGATTAIQRFENSPYNLVAFAHTETPKIINRVKVANLENVVVLNDIKSQKTDYMTDGSSIATIANNIIHVGAFEAADLKIVCRNAPHSMAQRAHISVRAIRPENYLSILESVRHVSTKVQQNILLSLIASTGAVIYAISGNMTPPVANALAFAIMMSVVLNSLLSRRNQS